MAPFNICSCGDIYTLYFMQTYYVRKKAQTAFFYQSIVSRSPRCGYKYIFSVYGN